MSASNKSLAEQCLLLNEGFGEVIIDADEIGIEIYISATPDYENNKIQVLMDLAAKDLVKNAGFTTSEEGLRFEEVEALVFAMSNQIEAKREGL